MIGRFALAAAALVLAPAASAQDVKPVDEIFADLTLGYCPMVLGGAFAIEGNPLLIGMGFPDKSTPLQLASGPVQSLSFARGGDRISFAGAPARICRVALEGDKGAVALKRLRDAMAGMASMGTDFQPAPELATPMAGATVEGFKAKAAGQTLNLQLFQIAAAKALIAQLYVTEE